MASDSQRKKFLNEIIPSFRKWASTYKFHIVSFAIAQACLESGYGTSNAAKNKHNILGIGPGNKYSSYDACIKAYYTSTKLGKSKAAKNAKTLDAYYKAFKASGYLGGGESAQSQYYTNIKSIIKTNSLSKYDSKNGKPIQYENKLKDFVSLAEKHSNKESYSAWTKKVLGRSDNPPWCALFVCACAKKAGVLNKIIPYDASASSMMNKLKTSKYGGKIYKPQSYNPKPGDLVFWRYSGGGGHVSIVNSSKGKSFETCDGNHTGGLSNRVSRKVTDSGLYRFGHPNWDAVGGTDFEDSTSSSSSPSGGDLYSSEYTRDDAIIREVAYVTDKSKRTTKKTETHLSVINYTTMLSQLWDLYGNGGDNDDDDDSSGGGDTSKLTGNAKTTVDFLMKKGLNAAAACGVAGNIYYESGFNPASIGDHGTSFGICQWHNARGTAMKNYVGSNWKSNLTGQLKYLWHDLTKNYSGVYHYIKSVKNTTKGAKDAADYFVRHFEVPANVDNESKKRQSKAADYFSKIKTNGVVSDGSLTDKQKKVISATKSVPSPGANLCASWVNRVFGKAGIGNKGGDACDLYKKYCKYKDKSKLKPGMIVAVDSWNGNAASKKYGHVGIYVGDGKVKDNIGYIHESKLSSWINKYQSWPKKHPVKWGWYANKDLTK